MEPGNLHLQHQYQEQFAGYYSSFSSQTAEYSKVSSIRDLNPEAAGIILFHAAAFDFWNRDLKRKKLGAFSDIAVDFLGNISSNTHNNYLTDWIPNSSVSLPPVSMTQGLSFCHASSFNQQSAAGELLLGKTKEEFPDSFCKLSDMMHTSSNVEETDFMSSKYKHQNSHDLGENQWSPSSFSSLQRIFHSNAQNAENLQNLSACRRYNFSHIWPTINISKSDLCSSLVSSSLDLNLQTMDLLSTSTYDGDTSSSQSSENTLDHFMRELKDSPSNSYNKVGVFSTS
ncbi:hypothetical protein POTOM_021245 [Populus tomentosa]|uniref:Uncharacterized protein n=1 Tax=Populus tomentosa TaxID=118781 RepID=A0A8X7ZM79_POPTO|nr:hypothetical protein POTOM_021245 [Populus tomentosa]